jgi:hypothetical protein
MLWALPAVLLPIVIHLLNRLRYKTVHWGAMIFLLKANRAATRRARIRQYLLLAARCLVILFLIWAMARPLVGGWIGVAAGGSPEAVLILLDRSASMEAQADDGAPSRRAHALSLLAEAAKQSPGSRFVLIENVLREPLEIADGTALPSMQMTEATDTAADLPAMFRSALEYLSRNRPGSAELWVASDLQDSNWRSDSAEWQDISARFAGLTQQVSVRVLDLSSPLGGNIAVAVKGADFRVKDAASGTGRLNLNLEFKTDGARPAPVPVRITREGAASQADVTIAGPVQRQNLRFDLPKMDPSWGKVELPADTLANDNAAYFVYTPPIPLHTAVVGEGAGPTRIRFATAPERNRVDRTSEILPAPRADSIRWKETALVAWASGTASPATEKALDEWVRGGGVLICFPPGGEASTGPLRVVWNASEAAPREAAFRVPNWDDLDGPLARTDSGSPLPIARMEILQRQVPNLGESSSVNATFGDGRTFLSARRHGAGYVFACAVSPDPEWGTFSEGLVLVPMMQRLVALGGQRLTPPTLATVGEWKPADAEAPWTALETDRRRDWRWHAGVYQAGIQRVALNRPELEDRPETVDAARLPEVLRDVRLKVMAGALELRADRLQSEIWPAMIVLTMVFMCIEMLLATSKAMLPVRPQPRPAPRSNPRPAPTREEVAV